MNKDKAKKYIYKIATSLYLIFLSATMIFGRAFSVVHVETPLGPIFVTEIILFICLPLIFIGVKYMLKLPKIFLIGFLIYFFLGSFHFLIAIPQKNIFALRDIVLFIYILFFPLTFFCLLSDRRIKSYLYVLILINMVGIIVGHFFVFYTYFPLFSNDFFSKMRSFNFGIYYGSAISFLVSFFCITKNRMYKVFILILSSLNLYLLVIFNVRTLWIALLSLFIFLFLILKRKFVKYIFSLMPIFVLIAGTLFYFDSKIMDIAKKEAILRKGKSMVILSQKMFSPTSFPTALTKTVYSKSSHSETSFIAIPEKPPSKQFSFLISKYNLGNIVWRLDIWRQTINFGFESPLFGKGFGVYPRYVLWDYYVGLPKKVDVDSGLIPPHNHLITIFYKMGFVGLGLFLFINIYIFIFGIRSIKRCKSDIMKYSLIGALGAFVFWHSSALFFDVIDSPPTSIFLWIIMGMIFAVVEHEHIPGR